MIPDGEDDMRFDTWAHATQMEGCSRGVGKPGDAEHIFKDRTKPDGDACQLDGTLKDASEMDWPNSPSDMTQNLPNLREDSLTLTRKRNLPSDEDESNESECDVAPKAKVCYISRSLTNLLRNCWSSDNRIGFLILMMKWKVQVPNLKDRKK